MTKLSKADQYTLDRCAGLLRSYEEYARNHAEFAGILCRIPVPGGYPLADFANALAEMSGRLAPRGD